MSQYNTGTINVVSGSQTVHGVWDATLAFPEGPFLSGDPLNFQSTGAVGEAISWDTNNSRLKFKITSTEQPALDEVVTSTGTISGTLTLFNQQPSFVGNVSATDIFVPTTGDRVYYEVASVPTRSRFTLNANFEQATLSDSTYVVSNSFTPTHGIAYAESGDQAPIEVNKVGMLKIDSLMLSTTAMTTVSGHLQSQIDAIDVDETEPAIGGSNGITVTSGSNSIDIAGFESEFVAASGSLQSQINAIEVDEIEPAILGGANLSVTSGTHTTTVALDNEITLTSGTFSGAVSANALDTGGANFWSKAQRPAHEEVGGEWITIDFSNTNQFHAVITANTTFSGSNIPDAGSFTLVTEQDATAGHTISFGENFYFPDGSTPAATTTSGAIDVWGFTCFSGTALGAQAANMQAVS